MRKLGLLTLLGLSACSDVSPVASRAGAPPPYLVYVTNEGSGDVSIVDPTRRIEIGRIPIGKRPRGLAISPDRSLLYVAVSGSAAAGPGVDESRLPPPDKAADGIVVIDLASRVVLRTLRGVSDPEQIAISPDGERLYVASEDGGILVVLGRQGNEIARLAIGGEPEGVAVSPDGTTVLATSEEENSLAVVRGTPLAVGARIKVGTRPRSVTVLDKFHAAVSGETDASISILDLRTANVTRRIVLPTTDRPMGIAALNDRALLTTTGRGGRLVQITLGRANEAVTTRSVVVGARPWGLALAPDRKLAFTANGPSNDVTVVDTATMKVVGKVKVGAGAWGVATG